MNPAPRALPRRTVIAASGTAVLAVAAACGSSDPAPPAVTTAAGSTSAATSTAGSTPAASSAATTSGTGAPASSAAAPTGSPLASVAAVQAAGSVVAGTDTPILLASSGGKVVAHTAICTHQGCTVAAKGAEADCPCHGSKYNATTGAVLNGPAQLPLATVPVTIANGQVYAG